MKHYQNGSPIRGRRNDPELDARLALVVFENQRKVFVETQPELLKAWHWLTTAGGGEGFGLFFSSQRGCGRASDSQAHASIAACLQDISCKVQAHKAVDEAERQGWELPYARFNNAFRYRRSTLRLHVLPH